ncbi:MAG TPA: hypothetical protein RMH99_04375 [Sandaracinaceae bacterium LLY-WYZ-13_1]|nr:hypothetical protein [Sandaracinaceae bacterium LLY-WYZ-13_1]
MSEELAGRICGGLCCLGMWVALAGGAGWLAQRRTRRVEQELGRRASPGREPAMLWYAGASVVWLSAAVLAAIGLARRERVRLGRDCLFILLGHFTVVALASILGTGFEGSRTEPLGPLLIAVAVLSASAIAAFAFAWVWSGLRRARLAGPPRVDEGPYRSPEEGDDPEPPGAWRFLLYGLSLVMWPAGFVSALVFGKPHDAHVGMWALRASLVQLLAITLAVCAGLGAFVVMEM